MDKMIEYGEDDVYFIQKSGPKIVSLHAFIDEDTNRLGFIQGEIFDEKGVTSFQITKHALEELICKIYVMEERAKQQEKEE